MPKVVSKYIRPEEGDPGRPPVEPFNGVFKTSKASFTVVPDTVLSFLVIDA